VGDGPGRRAGIAFRLLGPLEVWVEGRSVAIGSPKLRVLLARLLLDAGRPVSTEALAAAMWAGRLPDNPRRAVQVSVTRLRALLATEELIRTWPAGYSIDLPAERVDLGRFRAWLREADRAAERDDPEKETAALAEALAQWRGEPLADVPSELLERETVPGLREQRLRALERRIDLDLRRGRHADLIGELRELTGRHPVRERLWGQLMRALDGAGRRADALDAYHELRRHLADELGIEPSDELRRLHTAILMGRSGAAAAQPDQPPPVPRELPPDLPGFVGRAGALARLHALGTEVRVVVVAGTAGVGKTALAGHWARRVADRFPDGQLWVNLRGYEGDRAVPPEQALTRFLRALGVPGEQIPLDAEERAALFRTLMDGRRMLVVLDNAGSAEQVRPLLPGGGGSFVLVTSRHQLTGLVAAEGAASFTIDLFTVDEAGQLLANRVGRDRVVAQPEAVHEIVHRCARLPLALAVVAARAVTHPEFGLDTLAAELAAAGGDLDVFATGETGTDIRTVFSWSYQALRPEAARLFRLLGLHPGPDLGVSAAASLAGTPVPRVRRLLGELVRAHLLAEPVPDRFAYHDLLRAYATELAHANGSGSERRQAIHRMLDHYLHTGFAAAMLLHPGREPITLDPPAAGVVTVELADDPQAMAWFTAEHQVLLAMVGLAAEAGLDRYAWQLAWTPANYLNRQGHWADLIAIQHSAVAAARRSGDLDAEARANRLLATAYRVAQRPDDTLGPLRRSLELYRQLGDRGGEAYAHHLLASVLGDQGRYREALVDAQHALDLFRGIDHPMGQALAFNNLGWFHAKVGDHRQALAHSHRAIELFRQHADGEGEANCWDSVGYAYRQLGDLPQAVASYQRAIDLFAGLGNRYGEARELDQLGDVHRQAGDPDAARDAWRRALEILAELDHPEAAAVAEKLADTEPGRTA
jgi:DNA-binding SARP family transcriptional activator/tetratricopeptide (TPR) repeat protein